MGKPEDRSHPLQGRPRGSVTHLLHYLDIQGTKSDSSWVAKKTFTNVVLTADRPTINGHIYPRDVLEKAVKDAQRQVEGKTMFGEMNLAGEKVRLEKASHLVSSLELKGDEVVAEVKILDTEQGQILQELLKNGPPKLYPMGYGRLNEDMTITGYSICSVNVDTKDD